MALMLPLRICHGAIDSHDDDDDDDDNDEEKEMSGRPDQTEDW